MGAEITVDGTRREIEYARERIDGAWTDKEGFRAYNPTSKEWEEKWTAIEKFHIVSVDSALSNSPIMSGNPYANPRTYGAGGNRSEGDGYGTVLSVAGSVIMAIDGPFTNPVISFDYQTDGYYWTPYDSNYNSYVYSVNGGSVYVGYDTSYSAQTAISSITSETSNSATGSGQSSIHGTFSRTLTGVFDRLTLHIRFNSVNKNCTYADVGVIISNFTIDGKQVGFDETTGW